MNFIVFMESCRVIEELLPPFGKEFIEYEMKPRCDLQLSCIGICHKLLKLRDGHEAIIPHLSRVGIDCCHLWSANEENVINYDRSPLSITEITHSHARPTSHQTAICSGCELGSGIGPKARPMQGC